MALAVDERDSRVGDHVELADREVIPHQGILASVLDDERHGGRDHVLAEGVRERRRALCRPWLGEATLAGEDLLLIVHEADECDGDIEQLGRGGGEGVERGGAGERDRVGHRSKSGWLAETARVRVRLVPIQSGVCPSQQRAGMFVPVPLRNSHGGTGGMGGGIAKERRETASIQRVNPLKRAEGSGIRVAGATERSGLVRL